MRFLCFAVVSVMVMGVGGTAYAGVPECGGLRLEDASSCEIRGSIQCDASCSRLGIYKKACATKLHRECKQTCTLSAQPTCTDSCTTSCKSECDSGKNITCQHNCFGECKGSCAASCAGKADVARCTASCEATCDGECDVKCAPVVDASCYNHCIECCGGSCTAQSNMDCQTTCQDKEFEECEHELEVDCNAKCTGDGAIFCNGEFVIAGSQIGDCLKALSARGIATVDFRAEVSGTIGNNGGSGSGSAAIDTKGSGGGCATSPTGAATEAGGVGLFGALGLLLLLLRRPRTEE
jgi:MYXO-CTERM domain-containing protein